MVVIAHEGLVGPLPVVHIPPSRLLYMYTTPKIVKSV